MGEAMEGEGVMDLRKVLWPQRVATTYSPAGIPARCLAKCPAKGPLKGPRAAGLNVSLLYRISEVRDSETCLVHTIGWAKCR